ncbi:MAG: DUF378 domain-containing protein [Patescibacteria group bacterium]
MKRLNVFDWIAFALVIIGGLYWGLIGFLNFDIFVAIFGEPMCCRASYTDLSVLRPCIFYFPFACSAEENEFGK